MIDADAFLNDELGRLYPYPTAQPDWSSVVADAQVGRWIGKSRSPRRLAVVAAAVAILCGAGTALGVEIAQRLDRPPAWKSMINDWFQDGAIKHTYSCGDTREAIRQLQRTRFRKAVADFRRYEKTVCR
jgi:hypothetical protein